MRWVWKRSLTRDSAPGQPPGLPGKGSSVRGNSLLKVLIISSPTSERTKTNLVGFRGNSRVSLVSKLIRSFSEDWICFLFATGPVSSCPVGGGARSRAPLRELRVKFHTLRPSCIRPSLNLKHDVKFHLRIWNLGTASALNFLGGMFIDSGGNEARCAKHSSSRGQRKLAGYSPWGHKRSGHNLAKQWKYVRCIVNASWNALEGTVAAGTK